VTMAGTPGRFVQNLSTKWNEPGILRTPEQSGKPSYTPCHGAMWFLESMVISPTPHPALFLSRHLLATMP
jgi:hypothetical protein